MKFPLISVIVPIYNMEEYLSYCVNSLLSQTYTNLEILLIDDGSTDKSLILCRQYAAEDARCKVLHQENGGLCAARNLGLKYVTGEYICFIDSDDFVEDTFIETLYNDIISGDYDLSMVNYTCTSNYNRIKVSCETSYRVFTQTELMKGLYNDLPEDVKGYTDVLFNVVWNKLYKKTLLDHLTFTDSKYSEDLEFNNQVFLRIKQAIFNNTALHYYYQRDNSASHKKLDDICESMLNSYMICLKSIPDTLTEYRAACLVKLYKQILNIRYWVHDESRKKNVAKLIKDIEKRTYMEMLQNKYIPFNLRILFILFLRIPALYAWYMASCEKKAKRMRSK